MIECSCCERSVLEIKCPYCHRDSSVLDAAREDPKFCLKEVDDKLTLDQTHSYYYQVQTQLYVCDAQYSDFCVCTFASDGDEENVHIERIDKNHSFWHEECVPKAGQFFRTCLLPELLGNWYTRPTEFPNAVVETSDANSEPKYCYCRPEDGTMIACDNPDCPFEWFHFKCLHLTTVPKGTVAMCDAIVSFVAAITESADSTTTSTLSTTSVVVSPSGTLLSVVSTGSSGIVISVASTPPVSTPLVLTTSLLVTTTVISGT